MDLAGGDDSDEASYAASVDAKCGAYVLADATSNRQHLHVRENVKKELCVEFLANGQGFSLPRRWEDCRDRYDHVVSVGAFPKQYMHHIYSGAGKPPASVKVTTAIATKAFKEYSQVVQDGPENPTRTQCGAETEALKIVDEEDMLCRQLVARKIYYNKAEFEVFLRSVSPKCASYIVGSHLTDVRGVFSLIPRAERFSTLTAALHARGLQLLDDSKLCRLYIMEGDGFVDNIVDLLEEVAFVQKHTDYSKRCFTKRECVKRFRSYRGGFGWGDDADEASYGALGDAECGAYYLADATDYEQHRHIRENTKRELSVEFLQEDRGLKLPQKWEVCRERYQNVAAVGAKPKQYMNYIYTGEGKPPASLKTNTAAGS